MNIDTLSKLITKAAKESFISYQVKFGENEIIGYSILSHDTADSCGPVLATKKALENSSFDDINDFLFSPTEWDQFDNGASFNQVNNAIGKLYDEGDYEIDPEWHNKFRELVFEANVKALEQLISEGVIDSENNRNDIFVIFCLSDSETFETHEPTWVKRLNTEKVSNSYMHWHSQNA